VITQCRRSTTLDDSSMVDAFADCTPSSGNGYGVAAELWRGAGHWRLTGLHPAPLVPL
jgi:hypothetical protein